MEAIMTEPFSSFNVSGALTLLAPLETALSWIPCASSTRNATSLTPSPCFESSSENSVLPGFRGETNAKMTFPFVITWVQ